MIIPPWLKVLEHRASPSVRTGPGLRLLLSVSLLKAIIQMIQLSNKEIA